MHNTLTSSTTCAQKKHTSTITTKEHAGLKAHMLTRKKELLDYLLEQKSLTETEVKNIKHYRHFHYKSKHDMGAPALVTSDVISLAEKFSKTPRRFTKEETAKIEKDLSNLTAFRRKIMQTHRDLISFAETLFDCHKSDLDIYNKCSKKIHRETIFALRTFAKLTVF